MRYMWSATDSGKATPLLTHPVRFNVLSLPTTRRNSRAWLAPGGVEDVVAVAMLGHLADLVRSKGVVGVVWRGRKKPRVTPSCSSSSSGSSGRTARERRSMQRHPGGLLLLLLFLRLAVVVVTCGVGG